MVSEERIVPLSKHSGLESAMPPSNLPPPMNHVFVDYENMHTLDPGVIGQKAVTVTILLGAKQTKMNLDVVEKLVEHAASVHLVRLTSTGRNALDLTLAFYLGRAVLADPTAYFHIVSKDKDFDPLIEHLHSRHVKARRHDDFTALTFSGPTKTPPAQTETLVSRVLKHLRKNARNRPKSKKTLVAHLRTLAGKEGASPALAHSMIASSTRYSVFAPQRRVSGFQDFRSEP
jgi:hypothetical protein